VEATVGNVAATNEAVGSTWSRNSVAHLSSEK